MPPRSTFDAAKFDRDRIALYVAKAAWIGFDERHPATFPAYVRDDKGEVTLAQGRDGSGWNPTQLDGKKLVDWTPSHPNWKNDAPQTPWHSCSQ